MVPTPRTEKQLLITDLDNTLYDWVTFFGRSIEALLQALAQQLGEPVELLEDQLRTVNRRFGSVEQPFAIFELDSVRTRWPAANRQQLKALLDGPLHAFNSTRLRTLVPYPGIVATLEELKARGIAVVGYTEASLANAYYRLSRLGLVDLLRAVYVVEGVPAEHPDPARAEALAPRPGYVVIVPGEDRKPNPKALVDICRNEGVHPSAAVYVGDSRTKDIAMARAAGITSAWARYGTRFESSAWDAIVRVTNWTESDVARERELGERAARVEPDITLESFEEILPMFPA